jgi:hypothetical protein
MAPQALTMLSLIRGQRAINLAKLAESIRANRDLCHIVTEAACKEFEWACPSVEDAIVLLGGKRLCALLSNPTRRGRSATRIRRAIHGNSIAPAANLHPLETLQGEPK